MERLRSCVILRKHIWTAFVDCCLHWTNRETNRLLVYCWIYKIPCHLEVYVSKGTNLEVSCAGVTPFTIHCLLWYAETAPSWEGVHGTPTLLSYHVCALIWGKHVWYAFVDVACTGEAGKQINCLLEVCWTCKLPCLLKGTWGHHRWSRMCRTDARELDFCW
jgi:hypothetical protein